MSEIHHHLFQREVSCQRGTSRSFVLRFSTINHAFLGYHSWKPYETLIFSQWQRLLFIAPPFRCFHRLTTSALRRQNFLSGAPMPQTSWADEEEKDDEATTEPGGKGRTCSGRTVGWWLRNAILSWWSRDGSWWLMDDYGYISWLLMVRMGYRWLMLTTSKSYSCSCKVGKTMR